MTDRKAVLVTGSNGGLGVALCRAFQVKGYVVLATDRTVEPGCECEEYISADLEDVVDDEHVRSEFDERVGVALGREQASLSCLVNNAAVQVTGGLETLDISAFERSQRINVVAPFVLAQMLSPRLRSSRGSIVNIASIHARLTKRGFGAYSTSKAGLAGLSRALALDLAGFVTVNTVSPAAVDTPMLREGFAGDLSRFDELETYHPTGRLATPADVSALVVFLASDEARAITGAEFELDGGIGVRLHDPV